MQRKHYFSIAILACTLIAIISGYKIYTLPLWGHWPLYFWEAIWLVCLLFVAKKEYKTNTQMPVSRLILLSQLLFTFGFPPMPATFTLFFAFIPVWYIMLKRLHRGNFGIYFLLFLGWNITTTFWVTNTMFFAGVVAILANGFLMTLPMVVFQLLYRRSNRLTMSLAFFVVAWLSYEFLHYHWELPWPWLTLGNGLALQTDLIQWYEYTGVFGGSLWILLVNVLIFLAMRKSFSRRLLLRPLVVIIVPILISLAMYHNYEAEGKQVRLAVVNGNFEPHFDKFTTDDLATANKMMDISSRCVDEKTDYLIFPETSISRVDKSDPFQNRGLVQMRKFLERFPNTKIISGVTGLEFFPEHDKPDRSSLRPAGSQMGTKYFAEVSNAAIEMDASGAVEFYHKEKLVPGAEFFPYRKLFGPFKKLVQSLGGSFYGLRTTNDKYVFDSGSAVIAPGICYESVMGEYWHKFVDDGANIFVVMTNDGWWDHTAGYKQHNAFAALRCIEYRRSMARSANLGTCTFFNQLGDQLIRGNNYQEEACFTMSLTTNERKTFYATYGDYIPRGACILSLLLGLFLFLKPERI